MKLTLPFRSVAMTASPMLVNIQVWEYHSPSDRTGVVCAVSRMAGVSAGQLRRLNMCASRRRRRLAGGDALRAASGVLQAPDGCQLITRPIPVMVDDDIRAHGP